MQTGSLARRYARALIELAMESSELERLAAELEGLVKLMKTSPDLKEVLVSEEIHPEKKKGVLKEMAAMAGFSDLFTKTVSLLADKDRLPYLAPIADEYLKLVDRHLGRARATLVGAVPPGVHAEGIRKALEVKIGENIILTEFVDPEIMGGLILKMEGTLWDASVRGELKRLKEQMLA